MTSPSFSPIATPAVQNEELTAQQRFERGLAAVDLDERIRFPSEALRLKADHSGAFYKHAVAWMKKGIKGAALRV